MFLAGTFLPEGSQSHIPGYYNVAFVMHQQFGLANNLRAVLESGSLRSANDRYWPRVCENPDQKMNHAFL